MPLMRLPRVGDRAIFWSVFWGASAVIAVVAVVGFSPTSPFRSAPRSKHDADAPRMGRMVIDPGGEDCRQFSFDNDTIEITGARTVPCAQRQPQAPASFRPRDADGVLESMRRAFRGGDK